MPLLKLFFCSKKELSRKCLSVNHHRNFPLRIFFSKYDQVCSFLQIWSHLLKKSLMKNFIFVQWILRDLSEQLFYRTPTNVCLYISFLVEVNSAIFTASEMYYSNFDALLNQSVFSICSQNLLLSKNILKQYIKFWVPKIVT